MATLYQSFLFIVRFDQIDICGVIIVFAKEEDQSIFNSGIRMAVSSSVPESKVGLNIKHSANLIQGVSSSAAIEVAVGHGLASAFGIEIDNTRMALLCQKAENEIVGAACGVMDQVRQWIITKLTYNHIGGHYYRERKLLYFARMPTSPRCKVTIIICFGLFIVLSGISPSRLRSRFGDSIQEYREVFQARHIQTPE